MKARRRLAAIMFTDMVGYTALMQEDEALARERRAKHRQVQQDVTERNEGHILQYFGDGTLILFESVMGAVQSAIEIQQALRQEPMVPLRIGIHSGDIVVEDDGVYGDGVNLASRIESMAISGSILISDKVYDEIKNHHEFETIYLGQFKLKNVKRQVPLYAMEHPDIYVPQENEFATRRADNQRSVAVLPFINMSHDEENHYFADGLSEEILNVLSRLKGLSVTSRTSSFAFKNTNEDIRKIGKLLGVNSIIEGSVRKMGNRVRITAQLIDTEDGYHQWSQTFDRQLDDVFAVQDEVALEIANKFKIDSEKKEEASNLEATPSTKNVEAYKFHLQGMYHLFRYTPEDGRKALESFDEALKIDDNFGPAYAGKAGALTYLAATGQHSPQEYFPLAEEFATKAIKLDPENHMSYFAMGAVNLYYKWNFQKAKVYFEKAVAINPSSAETYSILGFNYLMLENYSKQLEFQQKAYDLNPLSTQVVNNLAQAYFVIKDYKNALKFYRKAIELDNSNRTSYEGLGWVFLAMEKYDEAIMNFLKYRSFISDPLKGHTGIGYAYAVAGKRNEAEECLRLIKERQLRDKDAILEVDQAIIHAGLGNFDEAFEHLQVALDKRIGGVIFIKINPIWEFIRKDERFQKINQVFLDSVII